MDGHFPNPEEKPLAHFVMENDVKDENSEDEKARIEEEVNCMLGEMTAGMPRPSVTHAFSCNEMLLMAVSNYAKNMDQKEMEKMMSEMKAMTRKGPALENKEEEKGDGAK